MDSRNNILSLLGLALRGGNLAVGEEPVEAVARARDARVLLLAAVLFLPGLSGLFQVAHMTAGQYGLIVLLAFLPTAAIQIYKVLCDRRK